MLIGVFLHFFHNISNLFVLFFCLVFLIFRTLKNSAMCYVLVLSESIYTGLFLGSPQDTLLGYLLPLLPCYIAMLSLCVTALTFHQLGYVAANAFGFNNNILYDDKKKYLTRKKISTFFSQRTQAQLQ